VLTKGEYGIHRPQILTQLRAQYFGLMKHVRDAFLRDSQTVVTEHYAQLFPADDDFAATVVFPCMLITDSQQHIIFKMACVLLLKVQSPLLSGVVNKYEKAFGQPISTVHQCYAVILVRMKM
jgi:hypothetical protein